MESNCQEDYRMIKSNKVSNTSQTDIECFIYWCCAAHFVNVRPLDFYGNPLFHDCCGKVSVRGLKYQDGLGTVYEFAAFPSVGGSECSRPTGFDKGNAVMIPKPRRFKIPH